MNSTPPSCPLCHSASTSPYHRDRRRAYRQCGHCDLVFVEARYHLTPAREKAEYDLHRNSAGDPGYRRFLNRVAEPLAARLAPASRGLDFGCGPGPTLSQMLEAQGHRVHLYDIYYAADESVWEHTYDFITATEVVEHLARPGAELDRLWRHLRPGGILALMTKRVIDREAFSRWHYKNDLTHISFFSDDCLQWLAGQWQGQLALVDRDVALITRPRDCPADNDPPCA